MRKLILLSMLLVLTTFAFAQENETNYSDVFIIEQEVTRCTGTFMEDGTPKKAEITVFMNPFSFSVDKKATLMFDLYNVRSLMHNVKFEFNEDTASLKFFVKFPSETLVIDIKGETQAGIITSANPDDDFSNLIGMKIKCVGPNAE